MKGNHEVIHALNEVLGGELVAINQYFMHARINKNRGFVRLAEHLRAESLDQMSHAEALIDRILFLEGEPDLSPAEPAKVGQTVPEQMQNDLALERKAIKRLRKAITKSRTKRDYASAALLCKILSDEEKHVAWIETQLGLIERLELPEYLQFQAHTAG